MAGGRVTKTKLYALNDKFIDALEDILDNGELVIVVDKETGEKRAVRVKPTAATLSVIRQTLRDNGISESLPLDLPATPATTKALPFTEPGDEALEPPDGGDLALLPEK